MRLAFRLWRDGRRERHLIGYQGDIADSASRVETEGAEGARLE